MRVILGAGEKRYPGWLATQKEELDLLEPRSFAAFFGDRRADAFLCEHVWEHLTEEEGRRAAALCFKFLKTGGYLRCAVPDANFPDTAYQKMVQVGGPGPEDHPAANHKIVYNYRLFSDVFERVGFEVEVLEFCDEGGRFHFHQWNPEDGPIYRSLLLDHRNKGGTLGFVSLIVDARKPA